MSLTDQKNWDVILVKISAMALLTVALTWLPEAVGSVFQIIGSLIYFVSSENDPTDFEEMMRPYQMQLIGMGLGKLASFVVLLLLARWMFSYPPMVRRALARAIAPPQDPPSPKESPSSLNVEY